MNNDAVHEGGFFAGEGFDFAFDVHGKNEQRALGGWGERAAENEFTAFAGFAGEAQMFFAERGAARDHVVDEFVEQCVVIHRVHLFRRGQTGKSQLCLSGSRPVWMATRLERSRAATEEFETAATCRSRSRWRMQATEAT